MNEKIVNIIYEAIQELNQQLKESRLDQLTPETPLYGANGILKSLSLVNLITDIEDKVQNEFKKEIILANEKALSQTRSPFSCISALAQYIESIIVEKTHV